MVTVKKELHLIHTLILVSNTCSFSPSTHLSDLLTSSSPTLASKNHPNPLPTRPRIRIPKRIPHPTNNFLRPPPLQPLLIPPLLLTQPHLFPLPTINHSLNFRLKNILPHEFSHLGNALVPFFESGDSFLEGEFGALGGLEGLFVYVFL